MRRRLEDIIFGYVPRRLTDKSRSETSINTAVEPLLCENLSEDGHFTAGVVLGMTGKRCDEHARFGHVQWMREQGGHHARH